MRAGKMRHYCAIEQFVQSSTSALGHKAGAWTTLYEDVPMEILPLGGRLLEIKRQLVRTATHQIWLRWIDGVKAGTTRVRYGSRYFNIGFVDEGDFKQHDLGLTCTEEVVTETTNG